MLSCMMRCALFSACLFTWLLASFNVVRAQDRLLPITVELGDDELLDGDETARLAAVLLEAAGELARLT